MEIKVRNVGKYREVIVSHNNTHIDMGLLDRTELDALAVTLKEAMGDLMEDLEV